ncbi:MAG: glycoside hydrolase family 3 N-terminal domain-containing protein [Solirubrobacteraceae bacterium]
MYSLLATDSAGLSTGGASPPAAGRGEATPSGAPVPSRPPLSRDRALGQMMITRVKGLTPSARLLARIRAGQVGGVILFAQNITSSRQLTALSRSLQAAAAAGNAPPLFIGVDQEGGPVKRIAFAPPSLSPAQIGLHTPALSLAEGQGMATGRSLRKLGVNLDFAPVADIPSGPSFLGERAFGHSTRAVVEGACGFALGLAHAAVAASPKHFPGLGGAGLRNTDTEIVRIGLSAAQLHAAYAPYRAIAALGEEAAPLVMISNASYPALDPSGMPATLSRRIVTNEVALAGLGSRLRVTDDLEVPAIQRYPDAPLRAVLAGEDLLMFAQDEAGSERAFVRLREALARGAVPESVVRGAAERIDTVKQRLLGAQQG